MSYLYLGQPYSHPTPHIMNLRFLEGERVAAEILRTGRSVYAPIVHNHRMAWRRQLPDDHDFWLRYCFDMLRKADALLVLEIEGWEESRGLNAEIGMAQVAGIPIHHLRPCNMTRAWTDEILMGAGL